MPKKSTHRSHQAPETDARARTRALLDQILQEATRDLNELRERARRPIPNDASDESTLRSGRQTLLAMEVRKAAEVATVEEALARLKAGQYGLCAGCGQEIPAARLEAQPFAVRCVACKALKDGGGF